MARTYLPNSATSEFYINLKDNVSLDYKNAANPGYAVFGKVIQGLEVVDAMALEPTGVVGSFSDVPLTDITLSLALQTQ
jgi:cyclophilin family peptidyl-prolyl cis-trans isomerase